MLAVREEAKAQAARQDALGLNHLGNLWTFPNFLLLTEYLSSSPDWPAEIPGWGDTSLLLPRKQLRDSRVGIQRTACLPAS